ncbi:MAG: ATP-binding protein [Lachnospiraceae bacterium]|nr:ATP-binding protein [Lachnospiraceae bacterium]
MKRKIEEKLLQWKNKTKDRKPLILNGARQVGKTYLLREFGEKYYKNTVYVNLEISREVRAYFEENLEPERILRFLEAVAGERIIPEETLIILDEIQSCEKALTSLKYFCEETPEYHITAAGSLLGVAINRNQYSFPVGKVETIELFPMDFEEFLWAFGKEFIAVQIRDSFHTMTALPEGLHTEAIEYLRQFLIVGGMPAAVNTFLDTGKFLDASSVQSEIVDNYIADMAKYASNTDSVKIRACYNSIPAQLAKENKKFQYKVVQKGGTTAIFGVSIEWLNLAGIVIKCQRVEHGFEPIPVYTDLSSFKLYMSDVGILTMKSGLPHHIILSGEGNTFLGALMENYVASQLKANGYDLYYWTSEYSAELDFVIVKDQRVYAIEVKKGEHVRSKSLSQFVSKYHPYRAIRFSMKNFGNENDIWSIPLYAVFCL